MSFNKTNTELIAELQEEVKLKRLEIIRLAKENEEKSQLIAQIKSKIAESHEQPQKAQIKWHEIELMVADYSAVEDQTFFIQMDEIHQEFLKKLKNLYPYLTSQDMRMVTYIKSGMNVKEIADIMHVLPSSIYINRSRLRKKLNLNPDEDLYGFLSKL
jgi:DNA-binding NarL/FixJ family response regulator